MQKSTMYCFLAFTVAQYMTRKVVTVTRATTMRELGQLFEKLDFNGFPVIENGHMVGWVSKFDFLKVFVFTPSQMVPHYDALMQRTVTEVMTQEVNHVEAEAPLTRVLQDMVTLRSRSFPVIKKNGELVGMISREDIMRALRDATSCGLGT